MRYLIAIVLLLSLIPTVYSQLPDGSDVPNFVLDDLDGVSHDLHGYLADGKGVIIDFSATWCGFCWNYHNTGTLETVWEDYGPSGTDEVMVFFIEADGGTSLPCLYGSSGCSGGSIGDWTTGVSHPIINPESSDANQLNSDFNLNFFPTLYAIGPNYKTYEVGQLTVAGWGNWVESFTLEADYNFTADDGCSFVDVEIEASGGFGTLQYLWSDGQTGTTGTGLAPGVYTVDVVDDNGYTVEVGPITIGPGNAISVVLDDLEDVSCYGANDGYIEVEGLNGSGDYAYDWSNGPDTYYNEDLSPGDYTVEVTDLATGCTAEQEYTILEADFFGADLAAIPTDCQGENGTLEIETDGGAGNFIYFVNGTPYNEPIIEDLDAGVYSVFIRDADNCTVSATAEIIQPIVPTVDTLMPDLIRCNQPMISLSADSSSIGQHIIYTWDLDTLAIDTGYVVQTDTFGLFTLTVIDTLSTCLDTLTFEVAADTLAPLSDIVTTDTTLTCNLTTTTLMSTTEMDSLAFSWTVESGELVSTEESIDVSNPATYLLQVADLSNGCTTTDSIVITQNLDTPSITLDQLSDIDCQNTTAVLSIADDTQATYQWTTEDGSIDGSDTGASIVVESAGEYTVESTSLVSGCTSVETFAVASSTDVPEVTISEPTLLTCDQESTLLQANDEAGYSYEWLDAQGSLVAQGAEYETTVPGDYTLRVTDTSNGCSKVTSVTVEQDIATPMIVLQEKGQISCITEEATISVKQIADHNYRWGSDDGVIVGGGSTSVVRVSAAGQYELTLTDVVTGCTSTETYTVTEDIAIPSVNIAAPETLTCDLDAVILSADPNDAFTYEWTTTDGSTLGSSSLTTLQVNGTGTYLLTTTNKDNGCVATQSVTVIEDKTEPVIEVLEVGTVDCNGANAFITLQVNANLTYEWTTEDGSIFGSTTSSTLEVDRAGTYRVIATDQRNGCSTAEVIEVLFSQAPPVVDISGDLLICAGGSTTLCMTTSDGDTQWYVDGNPIGTDQCVEINQAMTVEATSTNQIGCSTSTMVSVEEYVFPEISTSGGQQVLDCVTSEVTLGYEIAGSPVLAAVWTDANGQAIGESTSVGITTPGMYTLTLVNATLGCEESRTFDIQLDETSLPTFDLTSEGELTQEFAYTADYEVDTQVWTFGDGATSTDANPTYTYVIPGLYEVCLTTTNKCGEVTDCKEVVAALPIQISNQGTSLLDCHGDDQGSISVMLADGIPPYSVEWTGPNGYSAEGTEISGLPAGDYQAEITDAGNTEETLQYTISQPEEIQISAELIKEETLGQADGSISLIAIGGTGALTYTWSNGVTTPTNSGLVAGDYSVIISDDNGCQITMDYTVSGIISDVSDIDGLELFEAHPNPTSGLLTVTVEMSRRVSPQLSLIDITGKEYRSATLSQGEGSLQMDLSDLAQGLYLIRLTSGNQVATRRVVIVK